MDKLNEIKSKLHLLSSEQLDIIYRLISSWDIKDNKIQTDENLVKKIYESTISAIEDPLKNYSKEELLEEYGVLFYNPQESANENFGEVSIEYNYEENIQSQGLNNYSNTIKLLNTDKNEFNINSSNTYQNTEINDFDPLFPDTDFDSLTGLNKSKYDDLDFSALISKKPK
ncbi:MAG: hypothetical protein KHY10_05040 [Gemella haemolysans]|uniref:hypothetical protein n=1 Tax=Gemella haemolysans TaxID=1379 RepID=UPI0026F26AA4|nr:hypothetical protein [Gemella haemolysans]MBS5319038.1 hypothetical protein [Gemella haemolysans]